MSLWLQCVIGLDGRFCVSTAWRVRQYVPALKLFQSRNGTVLSIMQFTLRDFTWSSLKCVVRTTEVDSSSVAHLQQSSCTLIKGFSGDNHISSIHQIVSENKQTLNM